MTEIYASVSRMPDAMTIIADKVRGVASEKRATQEDVAEILGVSRQTISERYAGKVAFTGPQLLHLSRRWNVPVERFYPGPDDKVDDDSQERAS